MRDNRTALRRSALDLLQVHSPPPPLSDQPQDERMGSDTGAPHAENPTEEHYAEVQQSIRSPALSAGEEEGGGRGGQDLAGLPYR